MADDVTQQGKTVYVVLAGYDEDMRIVAAFSTRDLAETYAAEHNLAYPRRGNEPHVEEWPLDAEAGKRLVTASRATIDRETGEVFAVAFKGPELMVPGRQVDVLEGDRFIAVMSTVSAEHAVQVARERRQEWLGTRGAVNR
jgi:hypothetical protein